MWLSDQNRWYTRGDKLVISHARGAVVLAGWPRCQAWRCDQSRTWTQFRPAEPLLRIIATVASPRYVTRAMRRFDEHWEPRLEPQREGSGLLGEAIGGALEGLRALSQRAGQRPALTDLERQELGLTRRHQAALAFLDGFPTDVRTEVSQLPERHWHVLVLLARCPGAHELFESNPALAFALASSWAFRERPVQRPLRSARALLRKRRTAVAEWLGFPATARAVRVLAKIPIRAVSVRQLRFLRDTLHADAVPKALLHLPRLGQGVLRILTDPELRDLAGYELLAAIDRSALWSTRAAYLLRDAAQMHAALRGGRRLPVQRSLAALRRVHDELADQQNRQACAGTLALELPPAPVLGTNTIVPLTTPAEILEEGQTMHHCVFNYVPSVARGSTYIYRVLEPERATVSLVRHRGGWQLGQLSGCGNAAVDATTRAVVTEWLSTSGRRVGAYDESAP